MNVISNKRLREFARSYPISDSALQQWRKILEKSYPKSLSELRRIFNSVDVVDDFYVFNIKGNHFRIVCQMNFNSQRCLIRYVMTHAEYDRGKWK